MELPRLVLAADTASADHAAGLDQRVPLDVVNTGRNSMVWLADSRTRILDTFSCRRNRPAPGSRCQRWCPCRRPAACCLLIVSAPPRCAEGDLESVEAESRAALSRAVLLPIAVSIPCLLKRHSATPLCSWLSANEVAGGRWQFQTGRSGKTRGSLEGVEGTSTRDAVTDPSKTDDMRTMWEWPDEAGASS